MVKIKAEAPKLVNGAALLAKTQKKVDSVEEPMLDLYDAAAKIINNHVSLTGYSIEVSDDELTRLYQDFNEKFSPDALSKIPDNELLSNLFYTADSTNDSLCYWLEFNKKIKEYFGSISGGSSFKFGLYQRKDNIWVSGSPAKPEELSNEEALTRGREIRDVIIKGAEVISSCVKLDSVEDYEQLDEDLNAAIGKYASFAWIHKYYHMVFQTKFASWHSSDWQKHILMAFGIKPSVKYYGRSGQLVTIARRAKMRAAVFSDASYNKFGGIKLFCRIGTSDGSANYFSEWKGKGIVSIGWPNIGSLKTYVQGNDIDRKTVTEKLSEEYYPSDNRTASRKAGELCVFYRTNGDTIFVAMDGASLLSLGDNVGSYDFSIDSEMPHCKTIQWHDCFSQEDRLPNKSEGLRTSCIAFSDVENLLFLYHKYYYDISNIEEPEVIIVAEVTKRTPKKDLIHPLNQILYGAPGTGKTYSSAEYALAIIENREINQTKKTLEERAALMEQYTSCVENGQITFTTFHQSYGYEEFIQGIRPDSFSGTISFMKADGVFKKIADKALHDKENNYVIIIDEINRGNISKIFGELITLIEEDKRCGEINQLSATLPLGGTFTVPNNLYIIGTMNTADKSISLIDTALRRRFAFVEMAPDESIIENDTLRNVLAALNIYLQNELRSTDLLIGHSYFVGKSEEALCHIMNQSIIPLLYEYFYDDVAKVKKALDCLAGTKGEIDDSYHGRIRTRKKV